MIKPDPNLKKNFNRYIKQYEEKFEEALVYQLEYAVSFLSNHAKDNGEYEDQTSNLRGSIGGVVVKNGKAITYRGFKEGKQGDSDEGVRNGLEFINSKIAEAGSGYGIILVAGMDYSSYVENYHGLNVLSKTELLAMTKMNKWLNNVKSAMRKYKPE